MKIAIIGLDSVGLPLSLEFARSGSAVLGLDIDPTRVDTLNQGRSYLKHVPPGAVVEAIRSGTFFASTDLERIREVSAIIICMPAPHNENAELAPSSAIDTGRTIARYLQAGTLVVLDSPTCSGAVSDNLLEVLEVGSGLNVGKDFHLAFCCVRGVQGNPTGAMAFAPRVITGCTAACSIKARTLYSKLVNHRASVALSCDGAHKIGEKTGCFA